MGIEAFKHLTEIDSSEYLQGVDHKTNPIEAITQATADTAFSLIYPEINQVTCCKILKGHYLYCEFDEYRLIASLNRENEFFERLLLDLTGIDALPPNVQWALGKASDVESDEDNVINESLVVFGSKDNVFGSYTPKQSFAVGDVDDEIPIAMEMFIAAEAVLAANVEFDSESHEQLKSTLLRKYGDGNAEIMRLFNAFKDTTYVVALRRLNQEANVLSVLAAPKGVVVPMEFLSAGMVTDNNVIGFAQLANDEFELFY